jgi:hypothetical protein
VFIHLAVDMCYCTMWWVKLMVLAAYGRKCLPCFLKWLKVEMVIFSLHCSTVLFWACSWPRAPRFDIFYWNCTKILNLRQSMLWLAAYFSYIKWL